MMASGSCRETWAWALAANRAAHAGAAATMTPKRRNDMMILGEPDVKDRGWHGKRAFNRGDWEGRESRVADRRAACVVAHAPGWSVPPCTRQHRPAAPA